MPFVSLPKAFLKYGEELERVWNLESDALRSFFLSRREESRVDDFSNVRVLDKFRDEC